MHWILQRAVLRPLAEAGCGTPLWRGVSSNVRRRRRAYRLAEADPHTSSGRLKRLRERMAVPTYDLLRNLAEHKVGKAVTTADRRALWFDLQHRRYAPLFLGQVKPRMRLWTVALEESQLPLPRLPEVAIAGRSNSGKSTLVNYLCGRHSARMKREPGSTTELVFWQIGRPAQLCLVDLPGYGFATATEERRLQWTEFTLWYLRSRRNLRRVLVLVDARHGLKTADQEMISYLERYGINWQIVVTKCDKVVKKDLARRLTILIEDTAAYRKMAGQPIPISALKRKGMEALRDTLDSLKVMKEVVKDGIRRHVYDLLEQRRLRRANRAKQRREAKELLRQKEAENAAASVPLSGDETEHSDGDEPDNPRSGLDSEDLHCVLGDLGSHGANGAGLAGHREGTDSASTPKASIGEVHYSLDDRDSQRIHGFVQRIFPELPEVEGEWAGGLAAGPPAMGHSGRDDVGMRSSWSRAACPGGPASDLRLGMEGVGEGSDSDSDSEITGSMPHVRRFDPIPAHARADVKLQAQPGGDASFPFPALGVVRQPGDQYGGRAPSGAGPSVSRAAHAGTGPVTLQPNWTRPPRSRDQVYTEDDFASADDLASGKRRYAPAPPTAESRGHILADARRHYEREWAMELESIENSRASAQDLGAGNGTAASRVSETPQVRSHANDGSGNRRTIARARGNSPARPYIGKNGSKPIPPGIGKWRILGRPPARILKKQQKPDVAKVFDLKNKRRRRTNLASDLTWDEARSKWIGWYHRNKWRNFDRVEMAESPKREDVEEAFIRRRMELRGQGRRRRGQARGPRDEAAEPPAGA